MTESDICIDEYGRVCGVGIHDSQLEEFAYVETAHSLHVRVKNLSGVEVYIRLDGVAELTVASLWNGAILSDLYIWKVTSVPESCWKIPDSAWNQLLSKRATAMDATKLAKQIVDRNPEARLVQFEYSYGGSIVAVCDSFAIAKGAGVN